MKQLIPIDDYGMFCDIESEDIKELKGEIKRTNLNYLKVQSSGK